MRIMIERRSETDLVKEKLAVELDGELANLARRFVAACEALAMAGDDDEGDLTCTGVCEACRDH